MRRGMRALSLLDLVVVIAVLAALVYLVRLDWRGPVAGERRAAPGGPRVP